MKLRMSLLVLLVSLGTSSIVAHVLVSPPQSKTGATQKYEMRVHNEEKVAATAIELDVPEGVTIIDVARPAAGSVDTATVGDRITRITWKVDVPPGKYAAFPFTAKNPDAVQELRWNAREHLANGSIIEWSDKPGAQKQGSATKLTAVSE